MKSAILATVLSAAATISAAPGLSLDLAAPKMADIEALTVMALLKNTGNETLKLVNDPRTVLSKAPTDTFKISSESGSPKFTGIKMKFVPAQAIVVGNEAILTVLEPGQSVEVEHKLAGVYDFAGAGEGSYKFAASNIFNYVDASGQLKTITATTGSSSFKIAGKLAAPANRARRAVRASRQAATFAAGCDATDQASFGTAAADADAYVAEVTKYMAGLTEVTPRWTTWFGAYDQARFKAVYDGYVNIGTDATASVYDCNTCRVTPPEGANYTTTFAYVHPTEPGTIYLCGAFWKAPATGSNSKAGTIVHENSHFIANAGTQDYIYGEEGAMQLAAQYPEQAILNADNYEYFAENTPTLS